MNSLFHTLNIGTLAAWLSVAGFGTVGVFVPEWRPGPVISKAADRHLAAEDFTLGDTATREDSPADYPPETTAGAAEALPAPPGLPSLADLAPLPGIPDLSSPAGKAAEAAPQPKPSAPPGPAGKTSAKPAASGRSDATRLAAGRMPSPSYPAEARRKNQTGTVTVEFTVDAAGRVVSANAKSPSPWPLLDAEALRTVRSWSFPAGGAMTLQRPIVFQLR